MTNIIPFVDIKKTIMLDNVKIQSVDRNSLLRIGQNERVESFEDMVGHASFVVNRDDFIHRIGLVSSDVLSHIFYTTNFGKPQVSLASEVAYLSTGGFVIPFRYALTANVSDEFLSSSGESQIFNQLESIVDSYENALLHTFLFLSSYFVGTPIHYREAYSRLTALYLDLEAGTENIYYHVPSIHFYGTFYENDNQVTAANPNVSTASMQWFQTDDFSGVRRRMVKVPLDPASLLVSRVGIVAYGDYMVKTFKRYFLDVRSAERIRDRSDESNYYRFVFERYSVMNIPAVRAQTNGNFTGALTYVMPSVCVYMPSPATFPALYPLTSYQNDLIVIG